MTPSIPANRLMPSLIDRLVDPECMGGVVAGYDLRKMIDSVRVDLEDLLNTRRSSGEVDKAFERVRHSIVAYGLPDLNAFNGTSKEQCQKLAAAIATIIERYEPRLRNISVRLVKGSAHNSVAVSFHIDAKLNVDPAPEVGFETVLELSSGKASVTAAEGGA
jgi:type VI secretion system protein ImpF